MKEIWKNIMGFNGYQVSNFGRVRSFKTYKILKQATNNKGYKSLGLCKKGKMSTFLVHRLVAEAFIPNPDKLPCINHKDENPSNNCVSNLEWCDQKYNTNYGTCINRIIETKRKKGIWRGSDKRHIVLNVNLTELKVRRPVKISLTIN